MSCFRRDEGESSVDELYMSVQFNFTTNKMANRWSKFGIILCIMIFHICKSSAHFRRQRISKHSGPVWNSASGNSGGLPVGNNGGYLPAPTPKPYVQTRTVSSGQDFPQQGNAQTMRGSSRRVFISASGTGASREALMEQMRKMIKEQQERIRQQGGNGKFTITSHTSHIIHGAPQIVQGPKSLPVAPPPPQQPYKSSKPLTQSKFTKQEKATLLQYHNDVRQNLNPPPKIMEHMKWSDVLAGKAQEYAEKCEWRHSDKGGRRDKLGYRFVGENLYISTSYGVTKSVKSWADEKAYYDYWANTCVPGQQCGHYTQMIWGTTNMVGCGIHFCKKVEFWRRGDAYYVVCNYGPGGNINGARPYEAQTRTSGNSGDNRSSGNNWNSQTSRSRNTQDSWNGQMNTGNSGTNWNSQNNGIPSNSANKWNSVSTGTGGQQVISEARGHHKPTNSKKTIITHTKTSNKNVISRVSRRKTRSRRRRRRR
ncbi:cysteine-rich secretory protein LCCL domain-containing 2-like [Mizuhopecten yessoensis]|uniref:Peptidase inhibitor 16 n=1 Tax=Mizuhopecten yessoensis TaxID=6573 RepID=A0A210PM03_MIZYE|nr:cysteine-rich secretory protein LCCL domain-containing 2-like [Mizuhopecten yessoensis]OWF37538.1 Peptidase inhibitor 16 [Mizuhopecten yessoensis]